MKKFIKVIAAKVNYMPTIQADYIIFQIFEIIQKESGFQTPPTD